MERIQLALLRVKFIREAEEFLEENLRRERRPDDQKPFGPQLPRVETTAEEVEPNPLPQLG